MRRVGVFFVILIAANHLFAQKASDAWKGIISKCATSDLIKKKYLFFGVSNQVGPGSVWRFAAHKSIRLMFALPDAFPDKTVQDKIVQLGNTFQCPGTANSAWDVGLGLPFSTGATALSSDVVADLKRAKRVTVSVEKAAIDVVKETNWSAEFSRLKPDNVYNVEIHQSNRLVAENAVRVWGLKAAFDYDKEYLAKLVAKYKSAKFTLVNSSGDASTKNPETSQGKTQSSTGGNTRPQESQPKDACSNSAQPSDKPNSSPGASTGTGSATLHFDFTSETQLTICAEGPVYLLAAYSKLDHGKVIGLGSDDTPVHFASFELPDAAVPENARK